MGFLGEHPGVGSEPWIREHSLGSAGAELLELIAQLLPHQPQVGLEREHSGRGIKSSVSKKMGAIKKMYTWQ